MILSIETTYTKLKKTTFAEIPIVRKALSARPAGYRFMPRFKSKQWDGYVSLLKNKSFPTGLLPLVLRTLDKNNIEYQLKDTRPKVAIDVAFEISGFELRDYQQAAIEACLKHKNCCLKMATNAGKTLIAAAIIGAAGNKAIIVVPSRALLLQTAADFEQMLGIKIGRFGAGYKDFQDVTVTTMASLAKVLDCDLTGNIVVIVDECHRTKSSQIFDSIFSIPGRFRIGMSGTPLTFNSLADLKLIAATGEIAYEISNEEMFEKGYSLKPKVSFIEIDLPKLPGKKLKYQEAYKSGIALNSHRNSIIATIAKSAKEPVLVITDWVMQAKNIVADLTNYHFATGGMSAKQIKSVLADFDMGGILVCTPIFGEGVNMPKISTIIVAGGGVSHIKLLQRVGRGMRTGSDSLQVYDFIDKTNTYLLKHSEARYKLYKQEGFEIELGNAKIG